MSIAGTCGHWSKVPLIQTIKQTNDYQDVRPMVCARANQVSRIYNQSKNIKVQNHNLQSVDAFHQKATDAATYGHQVLPEGCHRYSSVTDLTIGRILIAHTAMVHIESVLHGKSTRVYIS